MDQSARQFKAGLRNPNGHEPITVKNLPASADRVASFCLAKQGQLADTEKARTSTLYTGVEGERLESLSTIYRQLTIYK